jgi:hypothetical protein
MGTNLHQDMDKEGYQVEGGVSVKKLRRVLIDMFKK